LFGLLNQEKEVKDAPNAQPLQLAGGTVVFQDVGFAYDARRPILHQFNLAIPAGHTVAVVGASGAGKSTLSRLLYRFYDVAHGSIAIDGQDIRTITQQSLRQHIGVVPQDTVLFNDTIAYNIAYGKPGASQAEVEAAAKAAHIHDFIIGMPDDYQTQVGERGLKLSGGEKQRVAIARTMLKNPGILIFDEATSALDSNTEQAIWQAMLALAQHRTTLIIAHRLSTIVHAHTIVVLDKGQVLEMGTHQDLLQRQGAYARLWQIQHQHKAHQ
jgi:ATP-binding cassette subfamily B protein